MQSEEIEEKAIKAGFRPVREFTHDLNPGDVIEVVIDEVWRGDVCVKAKGEDGAWAMLDLAALARKSERGLTGGDPNA